MPCRGGEGPRPNPVGPGEEKYKGCLEWPGATGLMECFRNWNDTPTTPQVILAQEELWVYEALLRVIRNTNDCDPSPMPKHDAKNYRPPTSQKNARIKEIRALEIGEEAA